MTNGYKPEVMKGGIWFTLAVAEESIHGDHKGKVKFN